MEVGQLAVEAGPFHWGRRGIPGDRAHEDRGAAAADGDDGGGQSVGFDVIFDGGDEDGVFEDGDDDASGGQVGDDFIVLFVFFLRSGVKWLSS